MTIDWDEVAARGTVLRGPRGRAWAGLAASATMCAVLLAVGVLAVTGGSWLLGVPLLVWGLLFAAGVASNAGRLRDRAPAIGYDDRGVHLVGTGLVPWSEIVAVRMAAGAGPGGRAALAIDRRGEPPITIDAAALPVALPELVAHIERTRP